MTSYALKIVKMPKRSSSSSISEIMVLRSSSESSSFASAESSVNGRQNCSANWRAEKQDFFEQISHFCMRESMADVEFVFNRQNRITV